MDNSRSVFLDIDLSRQDIQALSNAEAAAKAAGVFRQAGSAA